MIPLEVAVGVSYTIPPYVLGQCLLYFSRVFEKEAQKPLETKEESPEASNSTPSAPQQPHTTTN